MHFSPALPLSASHLLGASLREREGFDGWTEIQPRRRGRTAREFARRWRVPEQTALAFLEHFHQLGIAVESRGLWYGTPEAKRRYRFLVAVELGNDGGRP